MTDYVLMYKMIMEDEIDGVRRGLDFYAVVFIMFMVFCASHEPFIIHLVFSEKENHCFIHPTHLPFSYAGTNG